MKKTNIEKTINTAITEQNPQIIIDLMKTENKKELYNIAKYILQRITNKIIYIANIQCTYTNFITGKYLAFLTQKDPARALLEYMKKYKEYAIIDLFMIEKCLSLYENQECEKECVAYKDSLMKILNLKEDIPTTFH